MSKDITTTITINRLDIKSATINFHTKVVALDVEAQAQLGDKFIPVMRKRIVLSGADYDNFVSQHLGDPEDSTSLYSKMKDALYKHVEGAFNAN